MDQGLFTDTIYAVSSGGLPSGVAIIRLSGKRVPGIVVAMAGEVPRERRATLATFRSAAGEVLDRGLVLYFPAPASFTGEHCAEFHVHGGRAVVASLLSELATHEGLRHAEAGEFTRRAFINGKLDLTNVEALADLIAAETETQRKLAIENAGGAQAALYDGWRQELLGIRTLVEAELDFSDEADVPEAIGETVHRRLAGLADELARHRADYRKAEIVRDGYRVVLIGAPNVGKSSLLNAFARRDVAIVTEIPGTTRDLVEASLDLDGNKVVFTDTAGLRDDGDRIELIGMERARQAAQEADLVLSLVDPGGFETTPVITSLETPVLHVGSKADLGTHGAMVDYAVSSRTGSGVDELLTAIGGMAAAAVSRTGTIPSRLRHVEHLDRCRVHVGRAMTQNMLELIAEELRLASDALGHITGAVETEELLGAIFSEFCIGK